MGYRARASQVEIHTPNGDESQALVDFINDWTELQAPEEKPDHTYWTIHFDGSRQLEGSGAGVVLTSP